LSKSSFSLAVDENLIIKQLTALDVVIGLFDTEEGANEFILEGLKQKRSDIEAIVV
jgi:hypothetical protein